MDDATKTPENQAFDPTLSRAAESFIDTLTGLLDKHFAAQRPASADAARLQEDVADLRRRVDAIEAGFITARAGDATAREEIKRRALTIANKADVSADGRRICPFCGKGSKSLYTLNGHLRNRHADKLAIAVV